MLLRGEVQEEGLLGDWLRKHFGLSSRQLMMVKKYRLVYVDRRYRHLNYSLKVGQVVLVRLDYEKNCDPAFPMNLDIVYEDEQLLGINKEAGIVVHPAAGHRRESLLNGISHYQKERRDDYKIRLVHRLDAETSGLIIIAKTKYMHHQLSLQLIQRRIRKSYRALVEGIPPEHFICDESLGIKQDGMRGVVPDGKDAITEIRLLEKGKQASLVQAIPYSGRTHQIRIHLSYRGHPIWGDKLYGDAAKAPRLMLHCESMSFYHPVKKRVITLHATLKDDFLEYLKEI